MALLRRPVPATPPGGGQGKTLRWFCLLELPIPRRFPKETILPGGVIELVDGLWLLPPLLSAKEGLGLGLGPSGRGTSKVLISGTLTRRLDLPGLRCGGGGQGGL